MKKFVIVAMLLMAASLYGQEVLNFNVTSIVCDGEHPSWTSAWMFVWQGVLAKYPTAKMYNVDPWGYDLVFETVKKTAISNTESELMGGTAWTVYITLNGKRKFICFVLWDMLPNIDRATCLVAEVF